MGETGAAEGRETGLGQRGCQSSVGAAAVRSGDLECCQLSCLTFLRSVGVQSGDVVRDSAGRRALAHVRPVLSGGSEGTRDPQAGRACPTRTVRGLKDWSKNQRASLVKVRTCETRGFLSAL